MKYIPTLLLVLLSFISKGQKSEMGMGYAYSIPRGPMQNTIRYANGFTMDYYFTPQEKLFSVGMEMNFSGYGHDKTRQTYTFEDGSTVPMDIVVNNSFFNFMLAGRYFLSQGKKVQPYLTGKLGYSFFSTNLMIYDPDDTDHCEPVDSDILSEDGSVLFSFGGGLRMELLPKKKPGKLYANLSANYSMGGNVDYMNVDVPSTNHNHHVDHTSDVYAQFINTQTQVVHEHHVGNVYSSTIEMLDLRLGISFKVGR
jgi:hypothetical protein